MTLNDSDFIKKFMLHVLPKGLRKIRYFGYMGNRNRTASLEKVRALINDAGAALPDIKNTLPENSQTEIQSNAEPVCIKWGKKMVVLNHRNPFKKLKGVPTEGTPLVPSSAYSESQRQKEP